MNATSEEIKAEAVHRIEELTKKYQLNPNILRYFKEGRVYYSYLTAGGFMASIDTIEYDPRYAAAVREFEKTFAGYKVYHAIESMTGFGTMLCLLYVGPDADEWEMQRLNGDYLYSYIVNLSVPDFSEFGEIKVGPFGESGALIRVG